MSFEYLSPDYSFATEIGSHIQRDINCQIEAAIRAGLRRKGFEFDSPIELMKFAQENCRVEDNVSEKIKTYFVKDIPFLQYCYKMKIEFDYSSSRSSTVKAKTSGYHCL